MLEYIESGMIAASIAMLRFYIVAAGSKPKQGVAIARNLTTSEKTDWFPSDDT